MFRTYNLNDLNVTRDVTQSLMMGSSVRVVIRTILTPISSFRLFLVIVFCYPRYSSVRVSETPRSPLSHDPLEDLPCGVTGTES